VLAKQLATLDVLSRGRMRLLTVGIGSLAGEAEAVGVEFTTRGGRADEAIRVRMLWAGDECGVSFAGEFFFFRDVCSFPKPYQTTSLPIHIGGSSRAAARRAGRRGDGYFSGGRLSTSERFEQIELMRSTAREFGRAAEALEYTRFGAIDMDLADVEAHAKVGTTRLVVAPSSPDLDQQCDEISAFSQRIGLRRDLCR
jgi:alkanesulfonate monooxygenase SsuD/methylene tetrahydromethanopterin reductase-like flavin-dependent oxidoreductase (luciferase family)